MKYAFFVAVAALAWLLRGIGDAAGVVDPAGSAVLGLGCLLLGGLGAGELAARWRLPRLTGYVVFGMVGGPAAVGLVTRPDLAQLHLFEELALGLIALTAGGEFRLREGRTRLGPVLTVTTVQVVVIPAAVALAMAGLLSLSSALGPLSAAELAAAAAVLGVIAVANSPATTIAVITELRARGPLTDTVLGVTVLKDLVILLLFTLVYSLARGWVGAGEVGLGVLGEIGLEILASLGVGAALGALLGAWLRWVRGYAELAVLLLALVSVELGHGGGLEHLVVCMAAGVVVRNLFPREAARFIEALERSSPPIYVIFFALVGAGLDLAALPAIGLVAVVYSGVRLAATWLLTRVPAALAGAPRPVVSHAWMGFVAQAGLSLGLAARVARDLPGIGRPVAALVVAAVVLNQLAGPVLWAWALRRAGEARET